VRTGRLTAATGVWLSAHVAHDERHLARLSALRSGVVETIDATVGKRVKKGDRLLTIQTAKPAGKLAITTPIDGEVYSVGVALGEAAAGVDTDPQGATELVVVGDPSVVAVVSDHAPPLAHLGAPATLHVPRLPARVYNMKVQQIMPEDGRVRALVSVPERQLHPGDVGALFLDSVTTPGLGLPRTALLPGDPAVLVRRDGGREGQVRYVEVPVTITFDGGGPVVSVQGPAPEDDVVLNAREVR
jgi:hypothetical protein